MAPAPAVAAAPPPAKLIAWHTERLLPTHGAGGARGRDPQLRPSMAMVVGMLEGTMEVWEPWVQSLGFLRLYGRRTSRRRSSLRSKIDYTVALIILVDL
ncbi:Os06g0112150 [Oryza sativa Japonica Group]|uniref:Os06g0112150 protein n=1 Tax=Oryza sativa subsp. japonica TaxID=39947 RepID=C7J3X8_ORYSJ|nr:Os06g0112150 [Oryza sativa Japonica Group]|eukprot:NP_001174565.1 Os06g0112150 [Oryza sativa Japonica Group]